MYRCDIMISEKNNYKLCPYCGKKLFRIIETSDYNNIFIWCKTCKKEIKVDKKEPKSHK